MKIIIGLMVSIKISIRPDAKSIRPHGFCSQNFHQAWWKLYETLWKFNIRPAGFQSIFPSGLIIFNQNFHQAWWKNHQTWWFSIKISIRPDANSVRPDRYSIRPEVSQSKFILGLTQTSSGLMIFKQDFYQAWWKLHQAWWFSIKISIRPDTNSIRPDGL